ncbi:MAG: DUF362 domain-containing protein [Desulfobacterota bacterium]|nr:DUF362 domain-containing protein [Thermodesulfobacteriota bacterium]
MNQDKRVSVRRCASYSPDAVRAAVAALADDLIGGWRSIVPPGARVLLKPNLLKAATPEQVVCPHPEVVRAIAQACIDAGASSVRIGDSPGIGSTRRVAEKSGIAQVARDLGIEVVEFDETATITPPQGFWHRSFTIAAEVLRADVIINIAKCKTHAIMGLTLSVKNLYGVFVGKQKARWHFQCGRDYAHFARLLVELAYTINPAFSVVDAVIGMEGNGPGNGTPRHLGFLAASRDMVSLDQVVADILGFTPEKVPTLAAAQSMGFDISPEHITIIGDNPKSLAVQNLRPAARMHVQGPLPIRMLAVLLDRFMTTQPTIDPHTCSGCGMCAQICPAGALASIGTGVPPRLVRRSCIRCFCCQEICPQGAITARDPLGVRLLKHLRLE